MTSVLATESVNPSSAAESVVTPWTNPQFRALCWTTGFVSPILLIPIWLQLPLPEAWSTPQIGILAFTLSLCSITDLRWRKIPNWATYPALLWLIFFAVYHCARDVQHSFLKVTQSFGSPFATLPDPSLGLEHLGFTLMGGGVCFCVMFFVFRMAGGGAGDVKLATVIGAALGMELGLSALIASYIVAAVGILAWLAWSEGPRLVVATFVRKLGQTLIPAAMNAPKEAETRILQQRVALGPFFAAGTLIIILQAAGYWSW